MARRGAGSQTKADEVVIVTYPWASSVSVRSVSQIAEIVTYIGSRVAVIGCGRDDCVHLPPEVVCNPAPWRMHYARALRPFWASAVIWIIKSLLIQLVTAFQLLKRRKRIQTVVLYVAYPYHFPALIASKLLRLPNVEIITRSRSRHGSFMNLIERAFDRLDFMLLDRISLESPSLEEFLPLDGYKYKLTECGARYVDLSRFQIETPFDKRETEVGYVGRMRPEKGILVFLDAIEHMAHQSASMGLSNFRVTICGTGDCIDEARQRAIRLRNEYRIEVRVKGWVADSDLPSMLNTLKLLVLPTLHSEGLPTVLLQAMACGVVVMAPPVGGVPDIIQEGRTGYLLHSLSPQKVSKNILAALADPQLSQVSKSAAESVANEYSFKNAVERFRRIIG